MAEATLAELAATAQNRPEAQQVVGMRRVRPPAPDIELTDEEAEREYKGEQVDPLEELLAYDSNQRFTEEIDMTKYGFKAKWVIQNIQGEQHQTLIERASKVVKNTGSGNLQKQLDGAKFQALIVAYGVLTPALRDPRVLKKYNLKQGQEDRLLREMFKNRPGLLNHVSNAVLDLSGFSEDLVEVAKSTD